MSLRASVLQVSQSLQSAIIGQEEVINRLMVALLANGHVLMEGLPGTAKTRSIKTLSTLIEGDWGSEGYSNGYTAGKIDGGEQCRADRK